jgi:glutathione synthase/RimK-type ligase-like ATP-grasp enzyme
MYTSEFENTDQMIPEQLMATPSIIQEQITKAFEVRVVAFHSVLIAGKIHTQVKNAIDWRYEQNIRGIAIEPYTLPKHIEELCIRYMKKAEIKFGCFDFIVTPTGDHIFLEINEAGQFLFLEELCPDIPLLDITVQFLTHEGTVDNFTWKKRQSKHTLKDLQPIANTYKAKEEKSYTSSVQLK